MWREQLKYQETTITTRGWKGQSLLQLEKYGVVNRNAEITQHTASIGPVRSCRVPEERKFCERFIVSIHCNDPSTLLTALSNVRRDDGPEGILLNNFEKMLVYDIYHHHVTKSRKRVIQ